MTILNTPLHILIPTDGDQYGGRYRGHYMYRTPSHVYSIDDAKIRRQNSRSHGSFPESVFPLNGWVAISYDDGIWGEYIYAKTWEKLQPKLI